MGTLLFDSCQGKWRLQNGVWRDDSGNGNTLTATGTSITTGHLGGANNATGFNGTSDYLSINDASQTGLDLTGNCSLEAWIYPTAIGGGLYHIIFSKLITSGQYNYDFFIDPSGYLNFRLSNNGTALTTCTGGTILTINNWYHASAVYNAVDMRIYLGTLSAAPALDSSANNPKAYTLGGFNGTDQLRIGQGAANFFAGRIESVGVWSRDLSSTEVTSLYNLLENFVVNGSVSGTLKDKKGQVINASTYNTRVNAYPKNNTVSAPLKTALINAANGTWSLTGLQANQKYSTTFEYQGSYTPTLETDIAGTEMLVALP